MRDADATRAKLLEAAAEEFATRGVAGARVDRIAAEAGCNKSLIYAYFGSKEGLFDAVFDALVVDTVQDVPIDAADLPGYAARLYDWSLEHPRNIRLAIWQLLEGGRRDGPPAESERATRHKIEVIAQAQAAGTVSSRIPAPELLGLILAMTHTAVLTFEPAATLDVTTRERQRAAVVEAVRALVTP